MTTTTVPPGGGHSSPLGLMSCVREFSPQDLVPQTELMDVERNETKKRRFHPFRGLRKIFRRGASGATTTGKVRSAGSEETVPADSGTSGHEDTSSTKDAHRSRSTSELLASDEAAARRKSGGGTGNCSSGGMYTGGGNLSVSHDSVFTAEQRSTRGDSTSSDLDTAQSSSSLSIQQLMHQTGVRAELLDVVRRRGRGRGDTSEDEEDLGLPRSPCNSPTTTDKALKEHPTKSHSTCSDGSLLSMGSSEMDEDSFGQHSRHSSKLSLHDRRPTQNADTDLELGTASLNAPLSHSAARHKMSVRPKRTHGAPRRRRAQQVTTKLTAASALPTTPEVNEEASTRSLTPEGSTTTRETIAELYSSSSTSMTKVWNNSAVVPETQLKSASLPPGVALPSGSKLSRSRSNAGKVFAEEDEDASKEDKKKEESFFGRFLARRSGKKKKSKSEDAAIQTTTRFTEKIETSTTSLSSATSYKYTEEKRTFSVDSGISKVARSGPASRQRVQPIDIPSSPDSFRQKRHQNMDMDVPLLPPVTASSPEQPSFLEASPPTKKMHVFLPKTTKVSPVTVSPDKSDPLPDITPAIPIPSPRTIIPRKPSIPETTTRTILPQSPPKSSYDIITPAPRNLSPPKLLSSWSDPQKPEDLKTKVKITGLSSYQQRFMSYNDELDNGFKSLDETSEKLESLSSVSLTKSQSFRSRTVLTSSQDHASLPYTVNSLMYDTNSDSETFTDSLMSTTTPISDHSDTVTVNKDSGCDNNEIKIINTNAEIVEHVPQSIDKKEVESTSSVFISNEKESIEIENKKDGVTICVNPPQVQASANQTKTSNQVTVNIDSPEPENRDNQVSITKVQLKRESKIVAETTTAQQVVPEFLKIQLNKVDVKPSTNVVLSTSNSFGKADEHPTQKSVLEIETDRESGEIITDNIKRKFSTDVEIIEKETVEEIIEVPTKNIETKVSRSSFPIMISQPRKSSMGAGGESTPNKSFLKKKSSSLELDFIKIDDRLPSNKANSTDQLASKSETTKEKLSSLSDSEKQDSSPPEVIMRKKSLGSQKSDKEPDEPELMKVFARRSLKLKDSEAETLSQQVMVLVEADKCETSENSKRDSDKENECNESPIEERKKTIFPSAKEATNAKPPKEPLCESKFVETADVTLRKPSSALNNKLSVFGGAKYQRAVSLQTAVPNDVNDNTTNEEKRRNKSFIEPKAEKKPIISNYRAPHIIKDIEIKTTDSNKMKNEDEFKKKDFENEDYVPRFKRIQQRKEEWEKRAQQNMKKSVP